jgi:hypothetical protein
MSWPGRSFTRSAGGLRASRTSKTLDILQVGIASTCRAAPRGRFFLGVKLNANHVSSTPGNAAWPLTLRDYLEDHTRL